MRRVYEVLGLLATLALIAGCSDGPTGPGGGSGGAVDEPDSLFSFGGDDQDAAGASTSGGSKDDATSRALDSGGGGTDEADGAGAGPVDDAVGGGSDVGDLDPPDAVDPGGEEDVVVEPLKGPDIAVDPVDYTFSYIAPMQTGLIQPVNIFNLGDSALTITKLAFDVSSSSDYSMVLVPPTPKKIQPGKSTFVNVHFMHSQGGMAWLNIESDDPDTPVVTVPFDNYLKATVDVPEPCATMEPNALNFGVVERGTTKVLSAKLKNCSSTQPLKVKDIKRSVFFFFELTEEFQIDNEPSLPHTIQPGAELALDVSYSPKLAGPDSGAFEFHTDDPAEPKLALNVQGVGVEPPPEKIGLTIKLSWDTDQTDVDSHLLMPGGAFFDCYSDCHFGNPQPDWGVQGDWIDDPFLDVDDVDGYGPEHINISEPQPGTYRFIVHYYDDTHEGSWSQSSNPTVEVLSYGQPVASFGPEYLDSTNWNWDVFEIEWPSAVVTPLGNTYTVSSGSINACINFPFP